MGKEKSWSSLFGSWGIELARTSSFALAFHRFSDMPDQTLKDAVALLDIEEQDALELICREKSLLDVAVTGPPIYADARGVNARTHKLRRDRDRFCLHSIVTCIIDTCNNHKEN
jgi:hypothetical protein